MAARIPIQIIGGGLAGLTLGIALRRREVPVTVFEAGNYPRHRVCGEFINGRGLAVLDELRLTERFMAAGARRAESTVFFSGTARSSVRALPSPALCLSRFVMDQLLADEFRKLGGDLRTGERWNLVGVHASARPDRLKPELQREGIVHAGGRRLQPVENGWRWFGLKAHATDVPLEADLEMHLGKNGYVGICRLGGDKVNICGLFRRNGESDPSAAGFDRLRGDAGTLLYRRLENARFDEASFCSVAGLSLRPQRAADRSEVCIGDALTMIPPVTGNGMSLAFESARLAAEPLDAFSRGEISWARAQQFVAERCDQNFSRRLAWARWLQTAMFSPWLHRPLLAAVSRSDRFWRMTFARTR